MPRRLTTEDFIVKSKTKHGDKYDYSKVEYINNYTKVCIICPKHGGFSQRPMSHVKMGCRKCGNESRAKNKSYSNAEFIDIAKEAHGDLYDYSKVEYINGRTKVCIICTKHGEFMQLPCNHLKGSGCRRCADDENSTRQMYDTSSFINKAKVVHGDCYDYSKVEYVSCYDEIIIICPKHGEFTQKPYLHLHGSGCSTCKESKGERTIRHILEENDITFEAQKSFNDCKNKRQLPFDFYIPSKGLLIEYDGEQHYRSVAHFGGDVKFLERKANDQIKTEYARMNGHTLLRIPYWDYDRISEILSRSM